MSTHANIFPHFSSAVLTGSSSQLQKIIVKFFFCCFHLMMMKNSFSFNMSRKEVFILQIIFDCWALANSSTSITSHSIHRNRRSLWRHYSPILLLFDFFDANWVRDECFIDMKKISLLFFQYCIRSRSFFFRLIMRRLIFADLHQLITSSISLSLSLALTHDKLVFSCTSRHCGALHANQSKST